MDSSQPLSSVIFAIVQLAHEQNDMMAKMQVMYGISNMDFQLLILIRVWMLMITRYVTTETSTELWYGIIPWSEQPVTWWQIDHTGPHP